MLSSSANPVGPIISVDTPDADTVADISLLSGVLTPYERMALLPGLLPRNREETKLLLTHIMKSRNQKRIPEKDLFHELVDLEIGDDGDAVQEAHQWSKDGWYCLECMKDLYRQRLLDWWRQAKVKSAYLHLLLWCVVANCQCRRRAGSRRLLVRSCAPLGSGLVPTENDRYGYNCRTMTHRPAHALKLNVCSSCFSIPPDLTDVSCQHLCYPTRGDGTQPPQQQLTNQPN